jgi:hypothetical protein
LNYGLLGLASVLKSRGWNPTVLHGRYLDPRLFVEEQARMGRLPTSTPMLLSIPSSLALSWSRKFCDEVKNRWPQQQIIVGGRWVTAEDANWLRMQLPTIDLVVFGTAEDIIEDLLFPARWPSIPNTEFQPTVDSISCSPGLNYRLLDQYENFVPSFEVSRGCGRGCNYCAEAKAPLSGMKDANDLVAEIVDAYTVYGASSMRAYLEASLFCPSTQWIEQFAKALDARAISIEWRTETRVDSITAKQIGLLAKTGLKVLDLGLETASHAQIVSMGKSTNPTAYLRRAAEVLEACAAHGVWVKLNVLLYPGESYATFQETATWLERHRAWIKGLSVGPTIVFRYGESSAAYLRELSQKGARPVSDADLDFSGYTHLHLSDDFSNEVAMAESRKLSQSFMTARDYFDLKSFGYLPRSMSYEDFLCLARLTPDKSKSFRVLKYP